VTPDDARALLDAEQRRTQQRLAQLRDDHRDFVEASRDTNADDEHDPEGTTIAFERSQVGALVRQAEAHLVEVAAARERVAAGTYGVCERCGEGIPDGRLEARPTARLCVSCVDA
jgi:RNA polymerase-binding transcription factor DksA